MAIYPHHLPKVRDTEFYSQIRDSGKIREDYLRQQEMKSFGDKKVFQHLKPKLNLFCSSILT